MVKRVVFGVIFILYLILLSAEELFPDEPMDLSLSQPKTALVLSGGGAKGFAQIGMLKVIDELDIKVDQIIGSSIGAIVGGLYAAGFTAIEIEEIILSIDWDEIMDDAVSRNDLYVGQKRWLPTGNATFGLDDRFIPSLPQGIVLANKIHLQLFYETWHVAHINDFDELPIPFKCVATDLETGELILLENGSLADAMRASSSLPAVFLPFDLDGKLLIDGGVTQNLPADLAFELGGDFIIAFKTNTEMFSRENLKNPIQILNQTLNIGQQFRQSFSEPYADIIISPNTDEYSTFDFNSAKQLIEIGYKEALIYVDSLKTYNLPKKETITIERLPEYIQFDRIRVVNNTHLSNTAIRDYLGLARNTPYNKEDILNAFQRAYARELFDIIYPQIIIENDGYVLIVNVQERDRKSLSVNIVYNEHDKLIIGSILNMRNVLFKNSNFFLKLQLGGVNALDIDYTKYITYDFPLYYRIFPYYKQDKIYHYNEEHQRTRSYMINEYGATLGLGVHLLKNASLEPYIYYYNIDFSQDVGEESLFDNAFYSSGLGIKFYYENFDDYPYYTKGMSLFSKFASAPGNEVSDVGYRKMISTLNIAQPLTKKTSVLLSGEYGTYFNSEPVKEDPFYIGGIDSFRGLKAKALSAPFYRTVSSGLRMNPYNDFYVDLTANYLTYGNTDKWIKMDESVSSLGVILGFKKIYRFPMPARVGFAINDDAMVSYYLSLGFDYDAFFFSRR